MAAIMFIKSLSKPQSSSEAVSGKAVGDALLKDLQSSPLDEWKAIKILHEYSHPGVQEYVSNRLLELGEAAIERYLLQLIYLAVNKQGQHLERILLLLCARSFRIAIKTQWFLVALCQDHPKSKALEAFRDQAYKAALEGKWEVPIRSAKLDPLSPNNSAQFSPPFCSPTSSYVASHLGNGNPVARELLQSQPCNVPALGYQLDVSAAVQPPGSMVMSPPGASSAAGLGAAVTQAGDMSAPAASQRRSSAMQSLACLLPSEQRTGGPAAATGATVGAEPEPAEVPQQQQTETTDAGGSGPAWLGDSGISALAPAIRTSAPAEANGAAVPTSSDAYAASPGGGSVSAALPIPANATSSRAAAHAAAAAATASAIAAAPSTAGAAIAAGGPVRYAAGAQNSSSKTSAFSNGGGSSIAERIQALRRELGEGEGVSALLERAKQQGMAMVAAQDDDPLLSDDELGNRPMSPLSRLRFDTFGATLDFVEALCEASSLLTTYSQEERQRALRAALDHINCEIEKANRLEVAIWFPMGRRGDRVLGIASKEAVLLNSREKAPFMLFVEVLEGQNECGDDRVGAEAFVDLSSPPGADIKARLELLDAGAGDLSASMLAYNPGPKLEFGRRETYGIALTGIGAQHQLQYMHSAPGAAAVLKAVEPGRQQLDGSEHKRQVDSGTASGPAGPPSQCGTIADAAFSAAPGGPILPQPVIGQSGSEVLRSPTPTRAASVSHAFMLEEQAAALAAARRSAATAAAVASADVSVRSGGAASPVSEVVIPTRSASTNNIAAMAAAAMAASTSGGGPDANLAAPSRTSEAGAVVVGGGGGGSGLPQTPRSGMLTGLPPRPPSSSSQHQQQQQLPVGGISPINAAKEVSSSSSGGPEGGGLLGSNLLRRILGDRPEATGSELSQANSADASRFFTIASAAGAPSAPSSLATSRLYPSTKPPQAAREPGSMAPTAVPRLIAAAYHGAHLMDGKLQELAALGVFGPHSQAKSDPEVMEVLSSMSASLRGEMPMVRVKIVPIGPGDAVGSSSGGSGGTAASTSFAGLGRVKAAFMNQQPQAAAADDTAEGGPNKAMALLSRLVRRKPAAEDDTGEAAVAATAVADEAAATAAAAAGAAQVTIPVASGGSWTPKQQPSGSAAPRLVRLILFLPTQSLNLDIKSPHRKSRRTPSHEAIEMMADKYKVHKLPPPPECGPPLGPAPYGSSGCMDRVVERASEEGEGAVEDPTALLRSRAASEAEAEAIAWEYARGPRAATPSVRPTDWQPQPVLVPQQPPVGTGVASVLGPPLPREWESRSPRAACPHPAEDASLVVPSHPLAPSVCSGGDGTVASGPETPTASASQPPSDRVWISPPTAVAEGIAAAAGAAGDSRSQPVASSSSSRATGFQSSLTRILNRSPQQCSTQPQQQLQSAPQGIAVGAVHRGMGPSGSSSSSGSQPIGAGAAAFASSGPAVSGELLAAPAVTGPGPSPRDVLCAWLDGRAPQQELAQPRSGQPSCVEAGGTGALASSSSGLAASLQSLTRRLSRTAAGQQPGATPEAASCAPSTGSGNAAGPRGVSPVRGSAASAGGSTGQSQGTAAPPATVSENQAAEGGGKGPAAAQSQQRASGTASAEGGGGSGPSASASSGLAASLQRILNRSSSQQQPPAEGPPSASAGSSGAGNPPGPSPRGVSPVRSGAISGGSGVSTAAATGQQQPGDSAPPAGPSAATSTSSNRLSKLLSRLQQDQPQPQPSSVAHQAHQAQQQPSPPMPPRQHQQEQQQQQQQQQLVPGRPMAVPQGRPLNKVRMELGTTADMMRQPAPSRPLSYGLPKVTDGRYERGSLEERRRREAHAVYGERWVARVKRIQRESQHGRRKGWALRCVIVKSGDDCRQELLALQLVRTFGDIFGEAGLPLWVRYYEVLVTSNKTALIEMVPNTLSIHTIKSRSPPGTSLSDHFFAKFGRSGTPECTAAQRRFTESLAAYSLICYLLQIKDRHNGNILIDDDGRVVHIDYGFLLSNSPGGVNFESAPFKLTRELLEVMDSNSDGRPSEMFDYFKVLMIQGFIAARSHSDRIMLLVRVMAKSGFPCLKGGDRALKALEKRLMASLNEVQCVEHVLQLIAESLDAWRTRQYDYYQRVLNGIL